MSYITQSIDRTYHNELYSRVKSDLDKICVDLGVKSEYIYCNIEGDTIRVMMYGLEKKVRSLRQWAVDQHIVKNIIAEAAERY